MNIVLAGMPASGKTTISKLLGEMTGRRVADTDGLIVSAHGEINEIFAKYGEEYFRGLETEAVKRAAELENAVISTGGGCLLRDENVALLKKSGKIVFLKTSLDELVRRVAGDTTRPLLAGGAEEKLKKLMEIRQPLYAACADFTVVTDGKTADSVAREIAGLVL